MIEWLDGNAEHKISVESKEARAKLIERQTLGTLRIALAVKMNTPDLSP